jgi:16S rRNA (guanine1207-N2)-methyltransferase
MAEADPALAALGWGLRGLLGGEFGPAPDTARALFLNARPGLQRASDLQLRAQQSFKPLWDALVHEQGSECVRTTETALQPASQALILLLPNRQREAARAETARALLSLNEHGVLLAAVANSEGAGAFEADLRALCSEVSVASKHKCRVLIARAGGVDVSACEDWSSLDAPRPLRTSGLLKRPMLGAPGLFAVDRIDAGSALLIEHLPNDLAGAAADLGAGVGVLSAALLERCPGITSMDLFEAEARAVELAQRNLADARVPVHAHWSDVAAGIDGRFDVVVSNPPFHVGGRGLPALGQAFVRSAAAALKSGGRLLLVANAHLPYEAELARGFTDVQVRAATPAFKLIEARGR